MVIRGCLRGGKNFTEDVSLAVRRVSWSHKRARLPYHKDVVKSESLAQLGQVMGLRDKEVRHWLPTPGPKRVQSADRREIQSSSSRMLHPETAEGDGLPPQTDVHVAEMALHSVFAVRAMGILLRSAHQKGSTR